MIKIRSSLNDQDENLKKTLNVPSHKNEKYMVLVVFVDVDLGKVGYILMINKFCIKN